MVETMRGRIDRQDLPGLLQGAEMTVKTEVGEILVEQIELIEERKSAVTGERTGTRTLFLDHPERDQDPQADVLALQQGDHAPEPVLLLEEGQEPALDTMCQYPRFLLIFPPAT